MTRKKVKQREKASNKKLPVILEEAESYLSKHPSWRFSKIEKQHKWSLNHQNIDNEIYKQLQSYEGMSWSEIQKASGGRKNGTNNHWISIDDMCDDAKLLAEKYELGDQLFSLRLNATTRLFGLIEDGIFIIKWFDTNHEICPSPKRHT